ncbi:MAG: hypothetical protein DI536_30010 [Archangium gephyra]|uniref:HipA-like C-terminal domain-containing protein n=1 Tax=Archangium gephyra TaxID=48 RepID=A0A2W5T584_9BACT|nr:MAG: hypothetical protein DI536_30010 [Archangium gephyra]
MGNDDAHLGNYGRIFDEAGRARLAPLYDVLPMVEHLAQLISADESSSSKFKELWLRHVGL